MKALTSAVGHNPRLGFTLVELLTVIVIVAILASLFVGTVGWAKNAARRATAKNDVTNIVAAVNAYYQEYGVYPLGRTKDPQVTEVTFSIDNSDLFYTLRSIAKGANSDYTLNPKKVVFIEVPETSDPAHPRNGVANGNWYDPWGRQMGKPESGIYHVRIDAGYQGFVSDPYPGAGKDDDDDDKSGEKAVIHTGVIAWSLAKTGVQTYELKDQVLSWK